MKSAKANALQHRYIRNTIATMKAPVIFISPVLEEIKRTKEYLSNLKIAKSYILKGLSEFDISFVYPDNAKKLAELIGADLSKEGKYKSIFMNVPDRDKFVFNLNN